MRRDVIGFFCALFLSHRSATLQPDCCSWPNSELWINAARVTGRDMENQDLHLSPFCSLMGHYLFSHQTGAKEFWGQVSLWLWLRFCERVLCPAQVGTVIQGGAATFIWQLPRPTHASKIWCLGAAAGSASALALDCKRFLSSQFCAFQRWRRLDQIHDLPGASSD